MKKKVVRFLKTCLNSLIILAVTLMLLELSYRYNIIDFYKSSWVGLNSKEIINKKETDLLVFGDSFSAKNNGYVSELRKAYPEKIIVNGSSSGIGLKQINVFASSRIKQVNPKKILYQVYVGNDLLDVENLSNWRSLSFSRNFYWSLTNYFISVTYLNQRLAFFSKNKTAAALHLDDKFNVSSYDKRTKLFCAADSEYLYKTITLKNDFLTRYLLWKKELKSFLEKIPKNTPVVIAFVPHCAQVNNFYLSNMTELGARFTESNNFNSKNYTFFINAQLDFKSYSNLTFINPLPYFKIADAPNYRLYYENDPHFNKNGDKEFANFLKPYLFEH